MILRKKSLLFSLFVTGLFGLANAEQAVRVYSSHESLHDQTVSRQRIFIENTGAETINDFYLYADLFNEYGARVGGSGGTITAISYAGENVFAAAKTLPSETIKPLKIYGLSAGTAKIEIWAKNSEDEYVCIAGDEATHGSTARFNRLLVEVTP